MTAHLVALPVVLPLLTAAALVVLGERHRRAKAVINLLATLANLVVAGLLLRTVDSAGTVVYLAANWEAPFGIVLVADRLSVLMLALAGTVALCAGFYAEARWARVGSYFRPLFQIQLMGLNGAFLTGDLFNLFVFFEVMLAASYGLQLHGSGWLRVRSGLHYIAVNLLASALFLVGLALIYGLTGTLSMADVARKLALVPATDRGLLHAGMAILAIAFLIKAAIWPLNAWLVPAYTAASPPVAALFAVMTKVGVYVLLRLWTLFFAEGGPSAGFGAPVLVFGGLATLLLGTCGLLSSMRLRRIAAFSIIVSSGTLLAALGMGVAPMTSAALFYMLSATLAASTLFLLVELIERVGAEGLRVRGAEVYAGEDTNLDDEEMPLVGRAFSLSIALLGLAFMVCALVVAGLPPLSGFLAKFALLASALHGATASGWWFFGLLLVSGLAATVAFARTGIRHFWSTGGWAPPRIKVIEALSVWALLCGCVLITVDAERVLRYTSATAAALHSPAAYIDAVLSARPRPGPARALPAPEPPP